MKNFRIYFKFLKIYLDIATSPFVVKIQFISFIFQRSKKNSKNFPRIFYSMFSVAVYEKILVGLIGLKTNPVFAMFFNPHSKNNSYTLQSQPYLSH